MTHLAIRAFGWGYSVDVKLPATMPPEETRDLVDVAADAVMASAPWHCLAFAAMFVGDRGRCRYRTHLRDGLEATYPLRRVRLINIVTGYTEDSMQPGPIVLAGKPNEGNGWTRQRFALRDLFTAFKVPKRGPYGRKSEPSGSDAKRMRETSDALHRALASVVEGIAA